MAHSDTQPSGNRNWFKIAALALMPTLVAGLVFILMNSGVASEQAAEATSTTTSIAEPTTTPAGSGSEWESPQSVPVDLSQSETPDTDDEDPTEDESEEPEPAPEPPTPAELDLPAEVGVDGDGNGIIEISNLGESTLEIYSVDVNDNPIQMGEGADEMDGETSQEVEFIVDTSGLPFGEWEMTISFYTNGGEGHVKVKGHKFFIVHLLPPNLDISSPYVVPHQSNALNVTIVNNENFDVTVALRTEDDRLTIPEEIVLEPGENQVFVAVQALPVHHSVIDVLEFSVDWGETELGVVTIIKHGS